MLKKYCLGLLIAVIIIQLCVPAGMIISTFAVSSQAEKYGTEYKIPLDYISFNEDNGFLHYNTYGYRYEPYISVSEGVDGFAVLTSVSEEPENSSYIKNKKSGYSYQFPVDRIHVGKLKRADKLWLLDERNEDDERWYEGTIAYYSKAYLQAYVYNGKISVKDVFIDGVPAKQFIARFDTQEEATQISSTPQE